MLFALLCLVLFIQIGVRSKNQPVETFIWPLGQTNMQTCPFKKKQKVTLSIRYFVPRDPHCDSVSRRALGVQSGDSEGLLVTLFPALITAHTMRSAKKKKKIDETKWVLAARESAAQCHGDASVGKFESANRLWGAAATTLQWVFPTAPLLQ